MSFVLFFSISFGAPLDVGGGRLLCSSSSFLFSGEETLMSPSQGCSVLLCGTPLGPFSALEAHLERWQTEACE